MKASARERKQCTKSVMREERGRRRGRGRGKGELREEENGALRHS